MNALDFLKSLPDESIDLILTSPPYWALRDYGKNTYTIWGGDHGCEHSWENVEIRFSNHQNVGFNERWGHSPGIRKQEHRAKAFSKPVQTSRCSKCGAWYGALGLESNPEEYINHLTSVLTEAKRVLKKTGSLYLVIGDTYMKKTCSASHGELR